MTAAVLGSVGASVGAQAAGTFGLTAATWAGIGQAAGTIVGSVIDSYLFRQNIEIVNEEPRLDDLKVTSSAYGVDIAKVFGSYRVSGNIIWALPLIETRNEEREESGKGGGSSETVTVWYSYTATFALALCQGEIDSIKKIWFGNTLVYDNGSYKHGLTAENVTVYTGTDSQTADWIIQADKADTPAYRGLCYIVFNNISLKNYGDIIPNVTAEVVNSATLNDVLTELSIDSGLTDFDYSEGTNQVTGYAIPKIAKTRLLMEPLLTTYNFELSEHDHKIYLHTKKKDSISTITEFISFEKLRKQESELPKSITIKYANQYSDYQSSTQTSRRIDSKANKDIITELPLALSDYEVARLTETNLYSAWTQRDTYKFVMPYEELIAGNIVIIIHRGLTATVKIITINNLDNNELEINAVGYGKTIYDSEADGSPTGDNGQEIPDPPGLTSHLTFDSPTLDNSLLQAEILYSGLTGLVPEWVGGTLYSKAGEQDNLKKEFTSFSSSVFGLANTILLDGKTYVWDLDNSITLTPNYGILEAHTIESLLLGNNYIMIGKEILQFSDCLDNGNGSFTISKLLRGRRGTEHETGSHESDEDFILLNNSLSYLPKSIGTNYNYGAVTLNDLLVNISGQKNTQYNGVNLRPLSPSRLKVEIGEDDSVFNWMRRSRYISGGMKTLPIIDTPEKYLVELYRGGELDESHEIATEQYIYAGIDYPFDIYVSQISGKYGAGIRSSLFDIDKPKTVFVIPNNDLNIFDGNSASWSFNNGYISNLFVPSDSDVTWSKTTKEMWDNGDPYVLKIKPALYDNKAIQKIQLTINDYYNTPANGLHKHSIEVVDKTNIPHIIISTWDSNSGGSYGQQYYDMDIGDWITDTIDYIEHTVVIDVSALDVDYILVRSHGYTSSYPITNHGFKDMIITTEE